jgi:hypothetical protein
MPFSSNPQYSTYKTERVPLVKDVFLRSTNAYDALYENCIIEVLKNKDTKQSDMAVVKRPGTQTSISSSLITSEFRGMYFWQKQNTLIYAIGNTFYFWNVANAIGTATSSASLTSTTGEVGFEEFLYSDGHVTVVWSDGTKLGEISTTFVVTTSADADLPTHLPHPVFLDGYIFVVKTGTQDIYNSDNDAPLSWTPSNYISAEMSPDSLLRIERMSNYIVALGSESIEYFYDAANASGSPLGRNDTFYKQVRYLGGSIRSGNKVYMIGKYDNGAPDLFVIEDSKVTPVGNQQIQRFLSRITDFTTMTGAIVTYDSNTMYIFTVGGSTFSYNIGTDFFTNWKYKTGTVFNIKYFDVAYSTTEINTYMYNPDDNAVIKFSLGTFTDSGINYIMTVRTEPLDFDTLQMKFMGRLSLFVDNNNSASISLKWTDDDYQTYSNTYPIILNQELPSIRRLGGFRKRAFIFTNTDNQPIRFRGFEVDLNMGNS